MISYQDYMDKKFTHFQYYNEFVTDNIESIVVSYIGESTIKNSIEERFSDIPLISWDRASSSVLNASNDLLIKKGSNSSISVGVCIAKATARKIRGF